MMTPMSVTVTSSAFFCMQQARGCHAGFSSALESFIAVVSMFQFLHRSTVGCVFCLLRFRSAQVHASCAPRALKHHAWHACVLLRHYAGLLDASWPEAHQLDLERTEPPQYVVATVGMGGSGRMAGWQYLFLGCSVAAEGYPSLGRFLSVRVCNHTMCAAYSAEMLCNSCSRRSSCTVLSHLINRSHEVPDHLYCQG